MNKFDYSNVKMYFYEHNYLRDRQIDTVKNWPYQENIENLDFFLKKRGGQVSKNESLAPKARINLKASLPLINIKRRPKIGKDTILYIWGGLCLTGDFITDIDSPYALTGYNVKAVSLYKLVIRKILLSKRCKAIRCMSQSCRDTLKHYFGERVYQKSELFYPQIKIIPVDQPKDVGQIIKFIFVSTQFDIKGGLELIKAFSRLYQENKNIRLDLITHLPKEYASITDNCEGIYVHEANMTRDQVIEMMKSADVLVHPTYIDSFGLVILEALACGLAIIATDLYAIKEMVEENVNGFLIKPPIGSWDGIVAGPLYSTKEAKKAIRATDLEEFEDALYDSMKKIAQKEPAELALCKQASLHRYLQMKD